MRTWSRYFGGLIGTVSVLVLTATAGGESCSLELKKVDDSSRGGYIYRAASSQSVHRSFGTGGWVSDEESAKFKRIVKKEPDSYRAEQPIRGVVTFGTLTFGFVLDTSVESKKPAEAEKKDASREKTGQGEQEKAAEPEPSDGLLSAISRWLTGDTKEPKKAQPKGLAFRPVPYDRLYFDFDRDGDLTDEKVIEASSSSNANNNTYFSTSFPRLDVPIEVDSEKLDYACSLRVTAYGTNDYGYVNSSFSSAAYREGEITLGGKKHRLLLIDFNGNGRYDDRGKFDRSVHMSDNQVYASRGDLLYVDPDLEATSRNPYDVTSAEDLYEVSRLVLVDGQFHELTVSPSGSKLTLEPSKVPVGHVTNPVGAFSALVYGEPGVIKIRSDDSGKALVPAGSWKLKNYTLDRTGFEPAKKAAPQAEPSVLDVLAEALGPTFDARAPGSTVVAANATMDYQAVDVQEGQATELAFGPPYRPMVSVQYRQSANQVSLGMSLVGSAGEICTSMRVNGTQPAKPKFTVTDPAGKTVVEGEFEYG